MTETELNNLDWEKTGGLMPAIVQDAEDGRVLMLGYMNRDALHHTLETGRVTFYSRSRRCLWTKGETSGNVLQLAALYPDCDQDTLLVTAHPAGPTCHLGSRSCFDGDLAVKPPLAFLPELEGVIAERLSRDDTKGDSYVARLSRAGINKVAQKVGEEGVELALAGAADDDESVLNEGADLLFHMMVLLQKRGFSLKNVVKTLEKRAKPRN